MVVVLKDNGLVTVGRRREQAVVNKECDNALTRQDMEVCRSKKIGLHECTNKLHKDAKAVTYRQAVP